uniref:Uncharacterized protein n=1 Tax=Clytia hemisphaerica TaxID=252671 RepID=A0A7M5X998_9CNID
TDINFAISFFNHSTSTGIVTSKKIKEFDLHSNFTLCLWMKVEAEPTLGTDLVNVFNFKTFKSEMLLELDKNRLIKFAFDDKVFSFPRSNIDVWEPLCLSKEHLMLNVFTRSQNGTIDSIVIGILGPLSPRKLQQLVIIGHSEMPGFDVKTGEYKGSIAHLFLYSKALSVNQVAAFFDKNPPMDNVGFGWWDFKNQALPGYSEEIKPFSRD